MSRALVPTVSGAIVLPGAVTIEALIPQFLGWLRFVRERSENTVKSYGHDLAAFTAFCRQAGITDPAAVTFEELEMFVAWLRQTRKLKATSANRHRYAVKTFYRFLRRKRLVTVNPADDVDALKEPQRLPNYLAIPDQNHVLDTLLRDHSPVGQRDVAIVGVMLLAGLRIAEVVNLRLDQLDLEARTMRVVGKGDRERELPVVPKLRGLLRAYLSDGRPRLVGGRTLPWVFVPQVITRRAGRPEASELITRTVFWIIRRKVQPIVGKPIHPHALRHSFASRLRENGADLQLIQEALGHANIRTTTIYAHISTTKRRQEIERLLG